MFHVSNRNSGLFNHFIELRSVWLRLSYQLLQMVPTQQEHVRSKIQFLYQSGMTIKEISRTLKVDRNTVRKLAKKYEGDIADAKRLHRQTKMTPNTKDRVRSLVMNQVRGIRSVVKKLNFSEEFKLRNMKFSVASVRRYI